ncbi:hypothetical protein ACFQU3_13930 [Terrabacter sp. GCM10028922]|uniref:hypothetical protein n=1 Tax=Terrabacter sp. GCM10028922 TaxID=3273428 RepID=UPI0036161514
MKYLLYFVVLATPSWASFDDKATVSVAAAVTGIYLALGLFFGRSAPVAVTGLAWAALFAGLVGLVVSTVVGFTRGEWVGMAYSTVSILAGVLVLTALRLFLNPGRSLIEPR